MMDDDDDGDDDDGDDGLTLAHSPEILAVVTETGCNNENASRWEKTSEYEIVRTAVPYRHPIDV